MTSVLTPGLPSASLILLHLLHLRLEAPKRLVPAPGHAVEVAAGDGERLGLGLEVSLTAPALDREQARPLQHVQMFGHALPGYGEAVGQLGY